MQYCSECFGSNSFGKCVVLSEKMLKDGYCPFFKTKEEYTRQLEELDRRHEER